VYCWLTGYEDTGLQAQIVKCVDYEIFFGEATQINPNAAKIAGMICGYRFEKVKDPLLQIAGGLANWLMIWREASQWRRCCGVEGKCYYLGGAGST